MKKIFIIIVLILVVVGGGYYFTKSTSNTEDPKMVKEKEVMTKPVEETKTVEKDAMMKGKDGSGSYVTYSKTALSSAASGKRVLFFYANWCPTCIPTDADLTTNSSKIPAGATVIRVNYNDTDTDSEEEALAKKYEVTYQHTFVQIDEQGEVVTKWNGGKTAELIANIK